MRGSGNTALATIHMLIRLSVLPDAPVDAEYIILKKADAAPAHWNRLYNDWGKR